MTKLVKHNCKNQFMDEKYGEGMRVVNPVNKTREGGVTSSKPPREYRCTVCGGTVSK